MPIPEKGRMSMGVVQHAPNNFELSGLHTPNMTGSESTWDLRADPDDAGLRCFGVSGYDVGAGDPGWVEYFLGNLGGKANHRDELIPAAGNLRNTVDWGVSSSMRVAVDVYHDTNGTTAQRSWTFLGMIGARPGSSTPSSSTPPDEGQLQFQLFRLGGANKYASSVSGFGDNTLENSDGTAITSSDWRTNWPTVGNYQPPVGEWYRLWIEAQIVDGHTAGQRTRIRIYTQESTDLAAVLRWEAYTPDGAPIYWRGHKLGVVNVNNITSPETITQLWRNMEWQHDLDGDTLDYFAVGDDYTPDGGQWASLEKGTTAGTWRVGMRAWCDRTLHGASPRVRFQVAPTQAGLLNGTGRTEFDPREGTGGVSNDAVVAGAADNIAANNGEIWGRVRYTVSATDTYTEPIRLQTSTTPRVSALSCQDYGEADDPMRSTELMADLADAPHVFVSTGDMPYIDNVLRRRHGDHRARKRLTLGTNGGSAFAAGDFTVGSDYTSGSITLTVAAWTASTGTLDVVSSGGNPSANITDDGSESRSIDAVADRQDANLIGTWLDTTATGTLSFADRKAAYRDAMKCLMLRLARLGAKCPVIYIPDDHDGHGDNFPVDAWLPDTTDQANTNQYADQAECYREAWNQTWGRGAPLSADASVTSGVPDDTNAALYWSLDFGDLTLVMLDSHGLQEGDGDGGTDQRGDGGATSTRLGATQLAWARGVIQNAGTEHLVLLSTVQGADTNFKSLVQWSGGSFSGSTFTSSTPDFRDELYVLLSDAASNSAVSTVQFISGDNHLFGSFPFTDPKITGTAAKINRELLSGGGGVQTHVDDLTAAHPTGDMPAIDAAQDSGGRYRTHLQATSDAEFGRGFAVYRPGTKDAVIFNGNTGAEHVTLNLAGAPLPGGPGTSPATGARAARRRIAAIKMHP